VLLACIFPYHCFVIVPVLSLSCPGWLLEDVPLAVEDGVLNVPQAENSVLPPLGEEHCPEEGHVTTKGII